MSWHQVVYKRASILQSGGYYALDLIRAFVCRNKNGFNFPATSCHYLHFSRTDSLSGHQMRMIAGNIGTTVLNLCLLEDSAYWLISPLMILGLTSGESNSEWRDSSSWVVSIRYSFYDINFNVIEALRGEWISQLQGSIKNKNWPSFLLAPQRSANANMNKFTKCT